VTVVETKAELDRVVGELAERLAEREEMLARHRDEVAEVDGEVADLQARRDHLAAGTTDEELRLARNLIEVTWSHSSLRDEFDEQVVQEAVEDIAAGCPTLRTEYFCRRVYEGSLHRETYEYSFGPRHGHAVFRIGLTSGAREFLKQWGKLPLGADGEVQHAAIRYLLNLREAGRP
jgi:hypothetical protein